MAKESRTGTLIYPRNELSPVDFLHFVETDEFCDDWKKLGLNVEDDLWYLQMCMMSGPTLAPVIRGTGGLRKARFKPKGWTCGKKSGIRVCYAYFEKHWTVLLVMAYSKGRKDNLTAQEAAGVKAYLKRVEGWLAKHNY